MHNKTSSLVASLAILGLANGAWASGAITISDGINPAITVSDGGSGDLNTETGLVEVSTNVGVWNSILVIGTTKPAFGSATSPLMDVQVYANSTSAGTLTVTFSDENFVVASGTLVATITGGQSSGPTASADFAVYGDTNNANGLTTLLADTGTNGYTNPGNDLRASVSEPFDLAVPYSLTEVVSFTVSSASDLQADSMANVLSLACAAGTGQVGTLYSSTLQASGGSTPYTNYAIISGSLPPGLTLNSANGAITGVPTSSGNYNYVAQVTDSSGTVADTSGENCGINVSSSMTPPPCNGVIGNFVWNDLNGNGCQDTNEPGIANVKVDLYSGCGVSANTFIATTLTSSNGYYLFSGLCAGMYTVSFNTPAGYTRTVANEGCINTNLPAYENQLDSKCSCAAGTPCGICLTLTATAMTNLNMDCGYVALPSANCVTINAINGVAIIPVTLVGSGGCGGPYTFSATGLPANLTMSSTGTISGTPATNGTFNYTVTITDNCNNKGTINCSVTVAPCTALPLITSVPAGGNLGCNPKTLPTDASVQALITAVTSCQSCALKSTNVSYIDITNGCIVTRTFSINVMDACGNVSATKTVVYYWNHNKVGPTIVCPPAYTLTNSVAHYCTYTPADYGAHCNGTNASSILTNCFNRIYPGGYVQCGITNGSGYYCKFTSAANVCNYISCGGNPGCLNYSHSNPTTCEAGCFGGNVLCLKLNVDLGDCNASSGFPAGCGNLILNDSTCPLNGQSVRQILGICHTALGGGNISGYGCTVSNLNILCSNLNQSFEGCVPSSWCMCHLTPPAITNVPPSVSGYPTAISACGDTNVTLSYSDVITAGPCTGGYSITRTWVGVDTCGNSNYCTQNISLGSTKASVCGYVFQDCNGDGFLTPGIDVGLSNVLVTLKNAGGVVATNTTDSQGSYCFFNLTPGTYSVSIAQPSNTVQTAGTCTNHWLDANGNDCWNENDGYQHWKGGNGIDCWNANDGYQHWKNSGGQDCWTDKYGNQHTQNCTYVSCNIPTNNTETFTLTPCEALNGVNFAYQGKSGKAVVCVTGPATGVCGQTLTYTCTVTNTGNACFTACQVSACGKSYTCPSLSPGQGCSFPISYTCQWSDCGNFQCQANASCNYPGTSSPCTAQSSCYTQISSWGW